MAKSDDKKMRIVVKRVKAKSAAHHGGAWKIAYADFVTAMMAFFLLMWLLGSTTKADLRGIADYFQTPLKVALAGGSGTGDSSSVIQAGGTDLTRTVGQQKHGDLATEKKIINIKAAEAEMERIDLVRLRELKSRFEAAIEANPTLRMYRKQVITEITTDGLRIQILDELNRPMFDSGSAELKDYTREILREIAKVVNNVPNRISLSGHTDSKPYAAGERGYSNWELSADRANASRRELIADGIAENKIIRVVGLGSSVPLDRGDPHNPINRRISITVLNQKAEKRILDDTVNGPEPHAPDAGVHGATPDAAAPHAAANAAPATVAPSASQSVAPPVAATSAAPAGVPAAPPAPATH
jgi:chemotaxis protein MotB